MLVNIVRKKDSAELLRVSATEEQCIARAESAREYGLSYFDAELVLTPERRAEYVREPRIVLSLVRFIHALCKSVKCIPIWKNKK